METEGEGFFFDRAFATGNCPGFTLITIRVTRVTRVQMCRTGLLSISKSAPNVTRTFDRAPPELRVN